MAIEQFMTHYLAHSFMGILINTGAASKSTAGASQLKALQKVQPVELDKSCASKSTIKFGIRQTPSLGVATVKTPLGDVEFHVV